GKELMREYKRGLPTTRGIRGRGLFANRSRRYQFVSAIERGARRASYAHLHRLLERAAESGEVLPPTLLDTIACNYFYDQIVAIEGLSEWTTMYDLTVDGQHSFVVNGFVCHNSQGSEYPAVVIPLHTQHYKMLQRNLLYTGLTRGKQLVVLVGSSKALGLAVRRQAAAERYSALCRRLQEESKRQEAETPEA